MTKVSSYLFKEFSQLLAKAIVNEFSNIMLKTPLEFYQLQFERLLSKTYIRKTYETRIEEIFQALANIRLRIHQHLPLKSIVDDCDCETKKIVHANLSSPLYFTGNIILTYWPEIAEFFGLKSPLFHSAKILGHILRAVFYAQRFMETRFIGKVLCTRHRYEELAKNKSYLLGLGLSYSLAMEAAAFSLKYLTNTDDFLTRDAIGSVLIHLFNINSLAYNDPLPGNQKYPWDPFIPFRKLTFYTVTNLQSWLVRELNDPVAKKESIDRMKKHLGSYQAYAIVYFLLGKSEFFPLRELAELKRDAKQEKKQDILHILFLHPKVILFLKYYGDDIKNTLNYMEFARDLWSWLNTPLSLLPIQGGLISLGDTLAHIISGEPTAEIFKRIHEKINEMHPTSSTAKIEKKLSPPLPVATPVPTITYKPAPRPSLPIALPVATPIALSSVSQLGLWNRASDLYKSFTQKKEDSNIELKNY